jgi:hypothetical protein
MKLFKEMLFKLVLFTIFGLIYYMFMMNNYFSGGIFGFICFGITYVLVELIYRALNEKTKFFTKRISMIILIVIASIMYIGVTMLTIDYNRALNEEEPIFTWEKESRYGMFITYNDEGDMKEEKGVEYTEYSGLGYSIIVCSKNVVCDEPVKVMLFGLGSFSVEYTGRELTEFD